MKEKKNIDNIFKEGFKNLEATPSPRVWENIQAALKKEKKERKVIPLWIKLSGVAALLALFLTVGNSVFNSTDTLVNTEITNENIDQTEKQLKKNNSESEVEKEMNDIQVASEDKTLQNNSNQNTDASEDTTTKNNSEAKSSNKGFKNSSEKASNTVIASNNSENKNTSSKENSNKNLVEKNVSENTIKQAIATSNGNSDKLNSDKKNEDSKESIINKENDIFKQNKDGIIAENKTVKKDSETISADKKEDIAKAEEALEKDSKNKKSIFDAIAEKDEVATVEKLKKEKPEHRWNVAPNVAPVYYSSLGNGSSIDPTFADNSQKGDVNMSYGVQVSYALNNRLSVRTGINNVDLSYSTSGIEVGTGPVAVALRSIDYGSTSIVVTAADQGSFANASPSSGFGDITPKSTQGDPKLVQNINYYEVPLELKYALLDNKFGLNVIGGLSTLFLGGNEISVEADNFNTVLGEANNLSSVSFSTNVGLGLDYKLSKKFTFNIEPMFKYQLNPYTDSSVNFKPYYLGVYSGLSFKF